MKFSTVAILGGLTSMVSAAPSYRHVVHEKREVVPSQWTKIDRLDGKTRLPVKIGLSQSNLDRGHDMLMDVSDPVSGKYGKHWTAEEVRDFFAPSDETVDAVKGWLTSAGVASHHIEHSFNKGWINFEASAAEVEELLKTEYHLYVHESGKPHVSCDEYSVPEHISKHIDIITPTLHFDPKIREHGQPKGTPTEDDAATLAKRGKPGSPTGPAIGRTIATSAPELASIVSLLSTCSDFITPACLRALYNMPKGTLDMSSYGIVEYAPETYLQTDLDLFQLTPITNDAGVPIGTKPKVEGIDGGFLEPFTAQNVNLQAEPDLDLEYAMDLVYPQTITLYQVGDNGTNADMISFNNFLDGIDASYCGGDDPTVDESFPDPGGYTGKEQCGVWKPTAVISTSYGYNEHDLTPKYEERQCNEYMKLGMQGTSFLYSSGDYGVAGNGGQCIAANGSYNSGGSGRFNPSFPGTCPYITSVGATQIKPGASVTAPEEACETVIYSGGGFSNVFPMPSYQASAVKAYYANHAPPYGADRYNNSMKVRGFPDVSANGANYIIAVDEMFTLVYGTSASSPTFGSVVTLINEQRAKAGKSSLGFLNPAFYAHPGIFNDITNGGNMGCGTAGFTAVPGWDPVTGLGTPNYSKMEPVLVAL